MWGKTDPWGPLTPVELVALLGAPNSRLSSLLWQSVQKIRGPVVRADDWPVRVSMLASRLGCEYALLRSCVTGWLELEVALNSYMTLRASGNDTRRWGA